MGFYVRTVECDIIIKSDQQDNIFKAWCDLNSPKNEHLKHGGSWSGGKKIESWFSWMDPDYDKKCKSIEDILGMLGFDYEKSDNGDIHSLVYDSKTGDESLFFETAAPYISNGHILWTGEDDEDFYWFFDNGKFYEFGKDGLEAFHIMKEKQKMEQSIAQADSGHILKI